MFIAELAESFPELVTVIKLGHSAEARELFGLKLSKNAAGKGRMGFVINGAQHAREVRTTAGLLFFPSSFSTICTLQWVATATALYLAHALVTSLDGLLEKFVSYSSYYFVVALLTLARTFISFQHQIPTVIQ